MSRISAVLSKASPTPFQVQSDDPASAAKRRGEGEERSGEYLALIRLLFHSGAAVAIIGSSPRYDDSGQEVSRIADGLAAELGASGKRVAVVPVNRLLRMNPIRIPVETEFIPGNPPGVWRWSAPAGQKMEFLKPRETSTHADWLDYLRRSFDAVVLDCPNVEGAPGVTEVAAMADAAVLAVEAGRTSKQQVRQDQQALQLRGARVVGCILIQRN